MEQDPAGLVLAHEVAQRAEHGRHRAAVVLLARQHRAEAGEDQQAGIVRQEPVEVYEVSAQQVEALAVARLVDLDRAGEVERVNVPVRFVLPVLGIDDQQRADAANEARLSRRPQRRRERHREQRFARSLVAVQDAKTRREDETLNDPWHCGGPLADHAGNIERSQLADRTGYGVAGVVATPVVAEPLDDPRPAVMTSPFV